MTDLDPHQPCVQELVNQDDWAGLMRYYLAHQHHQAMVEALQIAQRDGIWGGHQWQLSEYLTAFAQDPLDLKREIPHWDGVDWTGEELATLHLLALFPRVVLCETAEQFPPQYQNQAYQEGLEATKLAIRIAASIEDQASEAFHLFVLSRGFRELRQLEAAKATYSRALNSYEELARRRPEVYQPSVAATLSSLGVVLRDLSELEAARETFTRALDSYEELARRRPEVYQPSVATTLISLGAVLRDLSELEAAKETFTRALDSYEELVRRRPDVYRPDLAMTLNNLGTVLRDLSQLDAARAACSRALDSYEELARQRPDVYRPYVATTLINLGNVLRDLSELEAARAAYHRALDSYEELARQRPDVYRPNLAMTLTNLGNVLRELNELEAARAACNRALNSYEELARQRPDVYQPYVAMTLINLGNVLCDLREMEVGRAAYHRALDSYEELARQRPDVYRPYVARTLNNLGNVLRELGDLEAASTAFSRALNSYEELARQRPDVYRPYVAGTLNNLGNLLCDRGAWDQANAGYARTELVTQGSVRLLETANYLTLAGRYYLNGDDEEAAERVLSRAVEIGEQLLAGLNAQETPFLYLHKKQFEDAYRYQIYRQAHTARPVLRQFSYLESLRKAEKRSLELEANLSSTGAEPKIRAVDERTLAFARQQFEECERQQLEAGLRKLQQHDAALLYLQPTQRGVVWYLLPPDGPPQQAVISIRLEKTLEAMYLFLHRIPRLMPRNLVKPAPLRTSEQAIAVNSTAPDWSSLERRLKELGRDAWQLLSESSPPVIDWLREYGDRLWISTQGFASDWPLEFLHDENGWLGLKRVLPRISTLGELIELLDRHPRPGSSLIVGNPSHRGASHLPNAQQTAQILNQNLLNQLPPGCRGQLLLGDGASTDRISDQLTDPLLSLFLYTGHGGYRSGKAFLCLSGTDQLHASRLRQFHWPNRPLIHLDCCLAGLGSYEGGGKLDGLTHAALTAGASGVIASNHAIGDTDASLFTEEFYGRWLSPEAPTLHKALLETRRRLAEESRLDHLLWGLTIYHGNPHIRHPWHPAG